MYCHQSEHGNKKYTLILISLTNYIKCNTIQNMSSDYTSFNPEEIIKKEARGLGNSFLGQVQEISPEYVVIEKGSIDKERFYIPNNLFARYDGIDVWFDITEEKDKQCKRG